MCRVVCCCWSSRYSRLTQSLSVKVGTPYTGSSNQWRACNFFCIISSPLWPPEESVTCLGHYWDCPLHGRSVQSTQDSPYCLQGLEHASPLSLQGACQPVFPSDLAASTPLWLGWLFFSPLLSYQACCLLTLVLPESHCQSSMISSSLMCLCLGCRLHSKGDWMASQGTEWALTSVWPLSSYQERPPLTPYKFGKNKDSPWPPELSVLRPGGLGQPQSQPLVFNMGLLGASCHHQACLGRSVFAERSFLLGPLGLWLSPYKGKAVLTLSHSGQLKRVALHLLGQIFRVFWLWCECPSPGAAIPHAWSRSLWLPCLPGQGYWLQSLITLSVFYCSCSWHYHQNQCNLIPLLMALAVLG